MSNFVILARPNAGVLSPEEIAAMENYFNVYTMHTKHTIPMGSTVIGRMSVLPFYQELIAEMRATRNAVFVNSYSEHRYIADLINYAEDLKGHTPPVFGVNEIPYLQDTPNYNGFVLKGETNSLKFLWDKAMHAPTAKDIPAVYIRLMEDSLLQHQTIYIRPCAKLKTFFYAPHGLPITNEYRTFCYRDRILATGFYWASYSEEISELNRTQPPKEFLEAMAAKLAPNTTFYTIDSAMTDDNEWLVVECNDGQMSGVSDCDVDELYSNLKKAVCEF